MAFLLKKIMRDDKSGAENFAKTLKLRSIFKDLSQLTWSIREAEQKFSVQNQSNDLLYLYRQFVEQLLSIADRAREEQE